MEGILKENKLEIALFSCILLIVTWLGDRLVADFVTTLPPKSLLRASDTVIHGLIAAISWRISCLLSPQLSFSFCLSSYINNNNVCRSKQNIPSFLSLPNLYNMGMAFAVASAVDLDHIITDITYTIQGHELTHWQRGFFHFVLPPFLFSILFYISSLAFKSLFCLKVAIFVFICIIGHDIRDALHHGLWFQPLGITPRFPYWLYVFLTMVLPFLSSLLGSLPIRAYSAHMSTVSFV